MGCQPAGTLPPSQIQFSFVYTKSGTNVFLSFPSGTQQVVTILGYDAGVDVLHVNWEGYGEFWYGCRWGQMPPVAQAACR